MNTVDKNAIQHWLSTQVAEQLGLVSQDIDAHAPFSAYGLDSITGVSLAGDLEEWLGISLSPTLLWDYPTVATLSQYLAETVASHPVKAASLPCRTFNTHGEVRVDASYAAHVLAQLDTLSDDEVNALLTDLVAA